MNESINYKNLDEALEYLDASNSEATILNEVLLSSTQYFGLGMNPTRTHPGYALDPYVKVFNNPSYSKATKSIDVSVVKGIAFHHPNDRKPPLKFSEGGWKEFLNTAIRQLADPPANAALYKSNTYYTYSDMVKGENFIQSKKPYRVYELIFDITISYFSDYKQKIINLYNSNPEPLEYDKCLIYKK